SLTSSEQKTSGDLPELTALRVLAALCVAVSHLHAFGLVRAERMHEILDGGRPAVAFFFVLSGFIMNHVYHSLSAQDHHATKRYAMARFARLYPTLLLALCLAMPSIIYLTTTHASDRLLQFYALKNNYAWWFLLSGLAQLGGLTGWIPAAAINPPWNGAAWSLSCEFFFYAIFPFVRPALQRRSSKTLIATIIAAWLIQGLAIVLVE